jgi:uncharacterized protein (DUF1810 family)
MPADPFNLARFLDAQRSSYHTALEELQSGRKRSHWMWFIFPQLRGLGHSATAQFYAIASLDEARAYLAHPVLGPRLHTCTSAATSLRGRSLTTIFGSPDDLKFRSCMTLFAAAAPDSIFATALQTLCDGQPDAATLRLLQPAPSR